MTRRQLISQKGIRPAGLVMQSSTFGKWQEKIEQLCERKLRDRVSEMNSPQDTSLLQLALLLRYKGSVAPSSLYAGLKAYTLSL